MSDESQERPPEVSKPDKTSDRLARPSVIRTKQDELIWERMQQAKAVGEPESATHIGLTPEVIAAMKAQGKAQKLEFFDSEAAESVRAEDHNPAEQTLIASNMISSVSSIEQSQTCELDHSDSEMPKIAQGLKYDGGLPTLLPDFVIKAAIEIWEDSEHPLQGSEDKLMAVVTASNPAAWNNASAAFLQLNATSVNLMKSLVRNELAFYGREDFAQDIAAANGKLLGENPTLGMAQISTKGIHEFEQRFPQFREFLQSKGYSGNGHEMKALLDPECVPMIVAAKMASIVDYLHGKGIEEPNTEQIAYGYNPDVYSYSDGKGGRIYKALYGGLEINASKALHWDQQKEYYARNASVTQNSEHVHNVLFWLKKYEQ